MTTLAPSTNVTAAKAAAEVNITNNKAARALVERFKALKAIEKAAADAEKERKEVVEPALRAVLGDAPALIVLGQKVLKVSSERKTILWDHDALRDGWPEAFEAIRAESPYTFLQAL